MLKNIQYLEHNFGHGVQHLSDSFAALMLLAFLIDQVLKLGCLVMKQIFAKYHSRTAAWEHLRSSFCAVAFWQLAGTVRPRPRDLHRVPRLRYNPDDKPPAELLGSTSGRRPDAPYRPDGQGTRISVPETQLNARRHAVRNRLENDGFPYRNTESSTSSPK